MHLFQVSSNKECSACPQTKHANLWIHKQRIYGLTKPREPTSKWHIISGFSSKHDEYKKQTSFELTDLCQSMFQLLPYLKSVHKTADINNGQEKRQICYTTLLLLFLLAFSRKLSKHGHSSL